MKVADSRNMDAAGAERLVKALCRRKLLMGTCDHAITSVNLPFIRSQTECRSLRIRSALQAFGMILSRIKRFSTEHIHSFPNLLSEGYNSPSPNDERHGRVYGGCPSTTGSSSHTILSIKLISPDRHTSKSAQTPNRFLSQALTSTRILSVFYSHGRAVMYKVLYRAFIFHLILTLAKYCTKNGYWTVANSFITDLSLLTRLCLCPV